MKLHIDIECETETCVHCPFWAMDATQNIQYCYYNKKDLDTSQTTHPPVPDWCTFIKDKHESANALMLYNKFREQFPETGQHAQGVYEYYTDRKPKLDFYITY